MRERVSSVFRVKSVEREKPRIALKGRSFSAGETEGSPAAPSLGLFAVLSD